MFDRETEALQREVLSLRGDGTIVKKTPISSSLHVTESLETSACDMITSTSLLFLQGEWECL